MPGENSTFKAISNVCHEAVGWPRPEKESARMFTKYPSGILLIWGHLRMPSQRTHSRMLGHKTCHLQDFSAVPSV